MTSYNFSTGPVHLAREVIAAINEPAIPHRSKEFRLLYDATCAIICEQFRTKHCLLMTGSGTTANDAMMLQIKALGGNGLILSNGEFGNRLICQAVRTGLSFFEYRVDDGEQFDLTTLDNMVEKKRVKWLLCCHCETSTGIRNDLESIGKLCQKHNIYSFADCMSTVGTYDIDLSCISMASASSGKGFASIPGLAVILSNIDFVEVNDAPASLDLGHYDLKKGIPFTLSSQLVLALNTSTRSKLCREQYELIAHYGNSCKQFLADKGLLVFDKCSPTVLTIKTSDSFEKMIGKLKERGIIVSHESDYLMHRNHCQLAFFGYYKQSDADYLVHTLQNICADK